jgi:hypothetical protein
MTMFKSGDKVRWIVHHKEEERSVVREIECVTERKLWLKGYAYSVSKCEPHDEDYDPEIDEQGWDKVFQLVEPCKLEDYV